MRIKAKQFQVVAIAALFLVPMMVAWFLYLGRAGSHAGLDAHGVLVEPPVRLGDIGLPAGGDAGSEARLSGRWTFLYLQQGKCAAACEDALIRMRQVRLALGKDASRVQRVFLPVNPDPGPDGARLTQAFPGMAILPAGAPGRSELIARIGSRQAGEILLADPLGNLILSYPPVLDPDGLFRDAKHLLRLSKIG